MVDLIPITRRKMNTNQPTNQAKPKNTEHQSFDFWVTFTGAPKTTATDLGYRGHSGSTSYVCLAPRATRGGAY
jgi:hypothetical protein